MLYRQQLQFIVPKETEHINATELSLAKKQVYSPKYDTI